MVQKEFSESYKSEIATYLKPLENRDVSSVTELREIIASSSSNMVLTVTRAYINFLLDHEIISDETAIYFRKALPSRKTKVDGYVPTDQDVRNAYQKIKKEKDRILFEILAFSGIRTTELVKMLKEFDTSRLIKKGKISKYPLNFNRGNKRSQYVYMPSDLSLKLHRFYINKDTVSREIRQYGVAPKYLRKWFYNFLIMNNVPESVADFIEGRAPESVGSMHYLSKVKQADYWYGPVVPCIRELLF